MQYNCSNKTISVVQFDSFTWETFLHHKYQWLFARSDNTSWIPLVVGWDGTTWTSFPSYQHYGRLRRSGSEPGSWAEPVCCLPQWTQPRSTDSAERRYSCHTNWITVADGWISPPARWWRGEPQSCCPSPGPEKAEHPSVYHDRGKVERTTCRLQFTILSSFLSIFSQRRKTFF